MKGFLIAKKIITSTSKQINKNSKNGKVMWELTTPSDRL